VVSCSWISCILLRLCSSTATRLVVWGWCAGTKNSPQASQPGAHNTEHRNNTTLFRLTNSTLQDSSDWAAHLLPSPDLVYPASLPKSFGPTCTLSLSITPGFVHFLSSPVQTTDVFMTSWLSPTHPAVSLIPTHFSSLHFIRSLFTSLTLPKSVCLFHLCTLHCTLSLLQLPTLSFCYITPYFSTELTEDYTDVVLHRCRWGLWRKEASASRRWYIYTNRHGIAVICFPLLYSTQDQLYGITRLISALHSAVWQTGCEAQHTFCAEVKSEWSYTPLPHTLSQHNSKLSKGTMLPLNSSQKSWLDTVIKRQLAKSLKFLPYKNIFIYYIHKYISLTSSL